jgi:hypothetical protein
VPNCDFYAAGADFGEVLDFVFERSDCQVFETYSPVGTELMQFTSLEQIAGRYSVGVTRHTAPSVLLSVVPPGARELVSKRRIDLKSGEVRYTLEGWGIVHLHLGGVGPQGLVHSHTNHNSEKRARAWEATAPHLQPVAAWDWKEVATISNRLNAHIRQLAVSRDGSRPVLGAAAKLLAAGLAPI